MPTPIPVHQLPGSYDSQGVAVTWTPGDAVNHNQFTSSNREVLIAHNTDTGPHNNTVKSSPDVPFGRTKDIVDTMAAGEYRVYQMFPSGAWATNGQIEVDPADATIEYLVLRVP